MTPEEIRTIRNALGLSQQDLADKLGVRVNTVARWEGGSRKPDGPATKLIEMIRDGKI